ncbi:MAG TPA: AraC family transcriptional regulator, partial [Anseongella sp.]|nr:AraC family transcriptional regulator [Anseongella sp.]
MVSLRCKMVVRDALEKLGLDHSTVELGVAEIQQNITSRQRQQLKVALLKSGLELMDDKKS